MAKKSLPPVVLPVVRIERGPGDTAEPPDLRNVVNIDTFRHKRDRKAEERDIQPPADGA